MAADKRQKRFKNASTNSSWEQGRARKKKLRLLKHDLNVRSNIALEWDDKNRSVVARREQIGLAWRDLIPFVDYVPHSHNILTDVLAIPSEIFDLENLKEVLSFEVWQTHLSENERNYLLQFLPEGAQTHQVIKELFAGDNFHFGNPLLKWGASLCSGNLHPDVILHQEQCFKASKNSYYSELQKFHNDQKFVCSLCQHDCWSTDVKGKMGQLQGFCKGSWEQDTEVYILDIFLCLENCEFDAESSASKMHK